MNTSFLVYEMNVTCWTLVNQRAFHFFKYTTSIKLFVLNSLKWNVKPIVKRDVSVTGFVLE